MTAILTFQSHICFWRIFSIKDSGQINSLKNDFSILLALSHLTVSSAMSCVFSNSWMIWPSNFVNTTTKGTEEKLFYSLYCMSMIWDSPFPVPLLKNSSSSGKIGQGLSMGMQYLWQILNQLSIQGTNGNIPDCMQLIFQVSCSRPFPNKVPNNL